MLQQSISEDASLRIKTNEHFQVAAKAHSNRLNGSTKILTLSVLHIIYNKGVLLAINSLLDLYRLSND